MNLDASSWWTEAVSTEERWRYIQDYVRAIENAQRDDTERALKYGWLYDRNAKLTGIGGARRTIGNGDPATENIVRNNVETATALLGNDLTRTAALTDGGMWSVQRRAKKLERFLEAQFEKVRWDPLQVEMVREACKHGNGYIHFYVEGGSIDACHVPFFEVVVDDETGDRPMQMARRRFVDRDALIAKYPVHEEAIQVAQSKDPEPTGSLFRLAPTQVKLLEVWRRPSSKGRYGRHTIVCSGATLVDEAWTYDWFPFVVYRWVKRAGRFYGCGLTEELASYQRAVNETNANIHLSHKLFAMQRMFVHKSDAMLKMKYDDDPSSIIPYSTKPPVLPDWQAVKPEIYRYKEQLKADAQRYSGIPDMAARSMKPVGLDSGAALREWTDIQASRLTTQKADIERAKLDAAQIIIALAKALYGANQDIRATWSSRNLAKTIKWSEVDMKEDMYVLRIEPASAMSRTPAGMRQMVTDLAATGALQPEEILRLQGIPDVQRPLDLQTAALEDIEAEIEELYDENWRAPEPFMDLKMGIARVQSAYLMARRTPGCPPKVLNLLQMWMVRAAAMLPKAKAPQQTQMAALPVEAGLAAPGGIIGAPAAASPGAQIPGAPAAAA